MGGGAGTTTDDVFVIPHTGAVGWRGLLENKKALGLAVFASTGGLLYGYNQGVFGQVQVMAKFEQHYINTLGDPLTKGLLTSILELGAMVGSIMSGPIADRISRKHSISVWCLMFMFGTALQAGAPISNISFLWAGRWFAGMGVGAISTLVPMYNSELAPPGIRGSLVALQQLAITFGIFISYWIGYGTAKLTTDASWRVPLAIQLLPAVILCVGAFFLPYSPRYLMLRGRQEEALLTLANLRNLEPEHIAIQGEFMALQAERLTEIEVVKERYGTDKDTGMIAVKEYLRMFTTRSLLHRLSLAIAAQSLQQWSGINAIIYYAPSIFENVGLTGETIPMLATGVVGACNLVFTIPAVLFTDNAGRKPILFWGATVMAVSLAIISAIVAQFGDSFPTHKSAGNAAVFFVYLFICAFAVSWGPLAWVVSAEVFPLSMRANGMALSAAVNWLMNFVVATITPIMLARQGYRTYCLFLAFMVIAMGWSAFILPELKGKTLEEVDACFNDTTGIEDRARKERVAREIGLDKLAERAVEHKENV